MSVPVIIEDGDFTVEQQNNSSVPSFPFYANGDVKTFIQRVTMRVDQRYYKPPVPMSQRWFPKLGKGYLVDVDQPASAGGNLVDYVQVYANCPARRIEYGSATYTVQQPRIVEPLPDITSVSVIEYTDVFPALYVYDYSLFKPLPSIYAPRLLLVQSSIGLSFTFLQIGNWIGSRGDNVVVAQSSVSRIWMGQIYERKSVYVMPSKLVELVSLPLRPFPPPNTINFRPGLGLTS